MKNNLTNSQSEFTLKNFNPTFVDITCWYGVEKYESDDQKLVKYSSDTPIESFEIAIEPACILIQKEMLLFLILYRDTG